MRHLRLTPEIKKALAYDDSAVERQVFAVMSGKGGVGKSIIANNLAMAFAERGRRTLLVDLDWSMGNQRVLCNTHSERSLDDVINGDSSIENALIHLNKDISLLAFLPAGDRCEFTDDGIRDLLNGKLREIRGFDTVIYDTSSGLHKELITLSQLADSTLLTVTPELTAISDCYALYKWLLQSEPNLSASLVINRVNGADEATDIAERFVMLTSKFLGAKPHVVGYLSESDAIREAVARQRSLFTGEPRPKIAAEFTRLAGRLSALSISRTGAQQMSSLHKQVNQKA